VGGSTESRQTATAADTLEIDVPPRHERNTQAGLGDDHVPYSAMDAERRCNQVKLLLMVIENT